MRLIPRRGLQRLQLPKRRRALRLERLEDRTVPAVSILNGGGATGLNFVTGTTNSGYSYTPPDTNGAAGPAAYVETVNQAIELFPTEGSSANGLRDGLDDFFFTTGGLSRADSGSTQYSPFVVYDELIGRFVVGDLDIDGSTHVSALDVAVSRSGNPTTLSAADWAFYKINTSESGYAIDNAGNIGYNADAVVFTNNMYGTSNHVQVDAINAADLANAAASPLIVKNDLSDLDVRATTMHDSRAGDPMWLVSDHGDNHSIDVIKMNGELTSSPSYTYTNLQVTPYSAAVPLKNPDGTTVTMPSASVIQKAAEANGTLVAAQAVSVSPTQDVIQWYAINVGGSGSPTLAQQGRVGGGNNTYAVYPGIDINPAGQIGLSYMQAGTDTATDYLSMWVTARTAADAAGTMEPPALVPAGTGQANYADYAINNSVVGWIGDRSGISIDPGDGSFWAANEFANTLPQANWGTAIACFSPGMPAGQTDLAVAATGPSAVLPGATATYTITVTNNGPIAAQNVVLSDVLPAGATLAQPVAQTAGTDAFTFGQSGGTVTETATANIAAGSSDTFTIVVTAPNAPLGTNFSNSAAVTSSTPDFNRANSSATVAGAILGPPADLVVTTNAPSSVVEGDTFTYTVTVTNNGPNPATGVVLTETRFDLHYISATASQGTVTRLSGQDTWTIGSIDVGHSVTMTITVQVNEAYQLGYLATVTATSADPNLGNNSVTVSIAGVEAPIVVSPPITMTAKSLTNVTVATFTHGNGNEGASDFSATINWGDGTTSDGTITESGTTYTVVGSHTYKKNGKYTITTTVVETSPQLAVSRGPNVGVVPLTQAELNAADAAAIREWAAAGLPAADLARMKAATADIVDLPGDYLGAAMLNGNEFAIDPTADGWGWSVNPNAKPAAGRMDLVTVVAHELGHIIGLDSSFGGNPNDLMYAYLAPGERRLPDNADVTSALGMQSHLPTPAAEDRTDWLSAVAVLKPKNSLYADWLATNQ